MHTLSTIGSYPTGTLIDFDTEEYEDEKDWDMDDDPDGDPGSSERSILDKRGQGPDSGKGQKDDSKTKKAKVLSLEG